MDTPIAFFSFSPKKLLQKALRECLNESKKPIEKRKESSKRSERKAHFERGKCTSRMSEPFPPALLYCSYLRV
jgi:hypothetical protein